MFDTLKVAKKIREARISQNMTQMDIADAMEISYQAVSNWERGNSMPDISKLEQLCQILQLRMEELLGSESADTLHHIMKKEENETETSPVPLSEIQNVAPLLPPSDMEELIDENLEQPDAEPLNLTAITALAPFLGSEYLDQLTKKARVNKLSDFAAIAPFMSTEALDQLALSSDPKVDIAGIVSLAPFLSTETLNQLARKITDVGDLVNLTALGPFLSQETLDALAEQADPKNDINGLVSLAPFLSSDTLNQLAQKFLSLGSLADLAGLAPFISKETLHTLVTKADLETEMPGITALAPFLSAETLNFIVEKAMKNDRIQLTGLYPFLSKNSRETLARHLM